MNLEDLKNTVQEIKNSLYVFSVSGSARPTILSKPTGVGWDLSIELSWEDDAPRVVRAWTGKRTGEQFYDVHEFPVERIRLKIERN